LSNSNGTFQPRQTFAARGDPIALAIADLNGDGKLDVVTVNYDHGTVTVLLGKGDGTLGPGTRSRPGSMCIR
jgi:hypothetical protein